MTNTQSANQLETAIDAAWEARDQVNSATKGSVREAVEAALALLDSGKARVAEKIDGRWRVHQWLKKAVLLSFRLNDNAEIAGAPGSSAWWDKIPVKFAGLGRQAASRTPASAPSPAASSAIRPISRRTSS